MKVYVHYETSPNEFTWVWNGPEDVVLLQVVKQFIVQYCLKFPSNKLSLETVGLTNDENETVSINAAADVVVGHAVADKGDIFVIDNLPSSKQVSSQSAVAVPPTPAPATPSMSNDRSNENKGAKLSAIKSKIDGLIESKHYRQAREECERSLLLAVRNDYFIHLALCKIKISTQQYSMAVDLAKHAIAIEPKQVEGYMYLSEALILNEDYAEALEVLVNHCEKAKKSSFIATNTSTVEQFPTEVIARKTQCLFHLNKHMDAANLVNSQMASPAAQSHTPSLVNYATIALEYFKIGEAVQSILKAIAADQHNKTVRKMFVKILNTDAGFEQLEQQIVLTPKSAAAYGLLGTIAKDHSAFRLAAKLFQKALNTNTHTINVALNLVHVLEVDNKLLDAYAAIRTFLSSFNSVEAARPAKVGGGRVGDYGFTVADLLAVLPKKEKVSLAAALTNTKQKKAAGSSSSSEAAGPFVPPYGLVWVAEDGGYSKTYSSADSSFLVPFHRKTLEKEQYDDNSLDIFAIAFTAIKILYVLGELQALPQIFHVIESSRMSSSLPLHESSIRNEHAYYQCIGHVCALRSQGMAEGTAGLSTDSTPSGTPPLMYSAHWYAPWTYSDSGRPLYICGDSHSLAPAWGSLTFRGADHLLIPKLVTGLKHYHLREESDFYPKQQFLQVLSSIPDESEIVFVVGEIDCRQGLLLAMERDRYPSLEVAMGQTISNFLKVVKKLVSQRKMKVHIHPVLPVLNETRFLVMQYNAIYRSMVQAMSGVHWLDFVDELLEPVTAASSSSSSSSTLGGFQMREGFQLDDTHIHPRYASLLERELGAVQAGAAGKA